MVTHQLLNNCLKKIKLFLFPNQNIQKLLIEMYKAFHDILRSTFGNFPNEKGNYHKFTLTTEPIDTVSVKSKRNPKFILITCKNYVRKRKPNQCPCRMCKIYLHGIWYIRSDYDVNYKDSLSFNNNKKQKNETRFTMILNHPLVYPLTVCLIILTGSS